MTEKRKAPPHAWKAGQSGNPRGKQPGSRNKATTMMLALMERGAKEITEAVIKAAKTGDLTAARMVIDRLVPPSRERPVNIALPDTATAQGCVEAQSAILQAVGEGNLLPSEGQALTGIVENRRRAIESHDLEKRIAALEGKTK